MPPRTLSLFLLVAVTACASPQGPVTVTRDHPHVPFGDPPGGSLTAMNGPRPSLPFVLLDENAGPRNGDGDVDENRRWERGELIEAGDGWWVAPAIGATLPWRREAVRRRAPASEGEGVLARARAARDPVAIARILAGEPFHDEAAAAMLERAQLLLERGQPDEARLALEAAAAFASFAPVSSEGGAVAAVVSRAAAAFPPLAAATSAGRTVRVVCDEAVVAADRHVTWDVNDGRRHHDVALIGSGIALYPLPGVRPGTGAVLVEWLMGDRAQLTALTMAWGPQLWDVLLPRVQKGCSLCHATLVAGGLVFVGRSGCVLAIDATSGETQWLRLRTVAPESMALEQVMRFWRRSDAPFLTSPLDETSSLRLIEGRLELSVMKTNAPVTLWSLDPRTGADR